MQKLDGFYKEVERPDAHPRRLAIVAALALTLQGPTGGLVSGALGGSTELAGRALDSALSGVASYFSEEAGAAAKECYPREGTGTMIMGSDKFSNYPQLKDGETIVVGGQQVKVQDAGGGRFWLVCVDSYSNDAPSRTSTTRREEHSHQPQDDISITAPGVNAEHESGYVTTTTTTTTTTTPPTTLEVSFDGGVQKGGLGVAGNSKTVVVQGFGDGRSVETSKPEKPDPEKPDPSHPQTPMGVMSYGSINSKPDEEEGFGKSLSSATVIGPDPITYPRLEAREEGESSVQLSPDLQKIREVTFSAIKNNDATELVELIKVSPIFNPFHSGVPGAADDSNPIRMMPNSSKLGGLFIFAFDKDAPDRQRYVEASTIAAVLLLAHQYQIIVNDLPEYENLKGSCLRLGDFSARDGHKTHDGNKVDLTSQRDCTILTEPGDGPLGVYLLGDDSGLDDSRNRGASNPSYSRELNEILLDYISSFRVGETDLVTRVLFNDPYLVEEGKAVFVKNHASHWHLETNPTMSNRELKNWAHSGTEVPGDLPTREQIDTWYALWHGSPGLSRSTSQTLDGSATNVPGVLVSSKVQTQDPNGGSVRGGGLEVPHLGNLGATHYIVPVAVYGDAEHPVDKVEGAVYSEPSRDDLIGVQNVRDLYEVFAPLVREEAKRIGLDLKESQVGFITSQFWLESNDSGSLGQLAAEHNNFGGVKQGGIETEDNSSVNLVDRIDGPSTFAKWETITGEGGFIRDWLRQRLRVSPDMFAAQKIEDYARALQRAGYSTSSSYEEGLVGVYRSLVVN